MTIASSNTPVTANPPGPSQQQISLQQTLSVPPIVQVSETPPHQNISPTSMELPPLDMMANHYQPFYDALSGPTLSSTLGGVIYNAPTNVPSTQLTTSMPMVAQIPTTSSIVHTTPFINPVMRPLNLSSTQTSPWTTRMTCYPLPSVTQAMTGSMNYVAPISSVSLPVQSLSQIVSTPQHQPQVIAPLIVSQL
ncbi:uncharacterized protein LOC131038208 [Cryptomeria japonica]|uniref:uncharacterized protein LOC131038208 n=1 Tax=Cryptomeria japonica TaxID=3369 RepID=UPI0027DA0F04|nr:uncharacterized protein LOC131038208 [Cryptomeria japonica]